eukprot:TRINITY_DN1210_c0_g1_i2.p1 TRINITY_DN1210_c0_g1~~TRINITY_DN1210_c0_g1_i2.p1  ORF type:complete len:144 (-),score=24.00 TRINITY_DN1210_c0_g1_i2:100-531(-)
MAGVVWKLAVEIPASGVVTEATVDGLPIQSRSSEVVLDSAVAHTLKLSPIGEIGFDNGPKSLSDRGAFMLRITLCDHVQAWYYNNGDLLNVSVDDGSAVVAVTISGNDQTICGKFGGADGVLPSLRNMSSKPCCCDYGRGSKC